MTRAHVKLLGPCFKTGQVDRLLLHHRLWAHERYHKCNRQPNGTELPADLPKQVNTPIKPDTASQQHISKYLEPPSPTYCTLLLQPADYTQRLDKPTNELPAIPIKFSHKDQT